MPLPLILGALGAKIILGTTIVAGAAGVAKGVKGAMDSHSADNVNERAEEIIRRVTNKVEKQRKNTAFALEKLGEDKLLACSSEIRDFLFYFSMIKNITLSDVMTNDEINNLNYNSETLNEMETVSFNAVEILKSGIGGIAGGTLLAWGSYSAIGTLGTASTGVGIAGLSGAAATNATLAWLGGGSIAAGGGGMALGSLVLGGLLAGPALLIAGGIFGAKAEEKLNNAYSNLSEARVVASKLELAITELENIENITLQIKEILVMLKNYLNISNSKLREIVRKNTDWKTYSVEEKQTVMESLKLAQGIKLIVDTPILTEDGKISEAAKNILSNPNKENEEIEKNLEFKNTFHEYAPIPVVLSSEDKIENNLEISNQYKILDIDYGVTKEEIEFKYQETIKEFTNTISENALIKELVKTKIQEIERAYSIIKNYTENIYHTFDPSKLIIKCLGCNKKNRIPVAAGLYKCQNCGKLYKITEEVANANKRVSQI